MAELQSQNLFASLLVPEDEDVPLAERCRRVNRVCSELGRANVILVSIHVNAAVNCLPGHRMRFDYSDGDPDQEAAFYILKHTACAACLTENGFMDGRDSCEFLLSDAGKQAIVDLHVKGIREYVKSREEDR